jgi:hypothetical protein
MWQLQGQDIPDAETLKEKLGPRTAAQESQARSVDKECGHISHSTQREFSKLSY